MARRICGTSSTVTNYDNVPTTIFTPLEYGCCGLSEEEATLRLGYAFVEVFHTNFWPLEWTVAHRPENACYMKLVVNRENDKVKNNPFFTTKRYKNGLYLK